MRNRGSWTAKKMDYLVRVQAVIDGLKGYWPLTLRQVYYQLVAAGAIPNETKAYKKLSQILTQARLDGMIPWKAIEDRARSFLNSAGWYDKDLFAEASLEHFLADYRRELLQTQDVALEIWVEKDALSRVCYDVAKPYCVSVIVARGFSSVSFLHEARQRIERNAANGKETVILYFGDLDPSGWEMLPAMMETLQEEMELGDTVRGVRCALTPEQVEEYGLVHHPDALKPTDSRAKKYMARFGDLAVELDALPPGDLAALVEKSIEEHIDIELYEEEVKKWEEDLLSLATLKEKVEKIVNEGD